MRAACLCAVLTLGIAPAAWGAPRISARAAILVESDLGATIFARNAHARLPIASTTKMMTALVALERVGLDRRLRAQPYAAGGAEVVIGLRPGERLTLRDMLRAMLLPSADDAAHSIAVDVGGSVAGFVRLMNAQARALGLHDTHYSTPVGLDRRGNYSSPADLAKLAAVLLRNPFVASTVARHAIRLQSGAVGRVVVNRNSLVGTVAGVIGVKTGHTGHAGYCLVAAARRRGATLISVVLGTPSEQRRNSDTLALLRYGYARYHGAEPVRRGAVYGRIPVAGEPGRHVDAVALRSAHLVVRRGTRLAVFVTGLPREVYGPLPAGAPLGSVIVRENGREVARVPLVARRLVGIGRLVATGVARPAASRVAWV